MCETLDEIHSMQLASIIAKMQKTKKEEKQLPAVA